MTRMTSPSCAGVSGGGVHDQPSSGAMGRWSALHWRRSLGQTSLPADEEYVHDIDEFARVGNAGTQ